MNKIIFNIGLNVGTSEPTSQLTRTIQQVNNIGNITNIRVEVGTYNGMQERTAIIEVTSHSQSIGALIREVSHISAILDQDAIAAEINEVGHLIYRQDWDNVQYPFDSQYFIK